MKSDREAQEKNMKKASTAVDSDKEEMNMKK